ncbi:MAG: PepSY-associated TM helix domain-containing protein [Candidatus Sphingomonas phytovorans]|nr:PepSY-associated TM helix domain-containing protein [Sphingomonas sp.]WEK00219.1 MAG: PepSY-associated TM helix domain-containing protein [Sphingomonas sp.]
MAQQGQSSPAGADRASLDTIAAAVRKTEPSMTVTTIAFPGTPFSSGNHIAIFLTGNSPLTSRILKPALADARTGEIVAVRDMPWYATALFMSQSLHFGDYGGLALKVAWAVMDVIAIVILGSGIYLWVVRQRRMRGYGPPKDAGDRPPVRRARLSRWKQWKLPLSLALLTIIGLAVSLIWAGLWVATASAALSIAIGVMIVGAAQKRRPEHRK